MIINSMTKLKLAHCIAFLLFVSHSIFAQDATRIRGKVIDKETGEGLPYVNISFVGTTVGTVTDIDGGFYIETNKATTQLKASYIGYDPLVKLVTIGASQNINFSLTEAGLQLESVIVESKRLRYRNKNNPAVNLIKLVIDNREKNRPSNVDFYEYDKYEKVEFDFNNINDKFRNKKIMKNFQMIFDYVDTSDITGKTYLPIFFRETSAKVYYRKSPERYVEYRNGHKMTGFGNYLDDQGISFLIDKMYQDVDIYDNNVNVLTQKFVSPISVLAPATYKYYIADTLNISGEKLYKLSFQPRNEADLAFVGNIFVTSDGDYAVKKISMRISKRVNLNHVEDLFIDQEFEKTELGNYFLKTDKVSMDFDMPGISSSGMGMYGKRTLSFQDRKFGVERPDSIYAGVERIIENDFTKERDESFWTEARHMELSHNEKGVYEMTEKVQNLPAFKRMMDITMLLLIGYKDFGDYAVGPVNAFYSWNNIEGFRLRLGGRTNSSFSKHWQLEAYGAYGFKDKEWKYSGIVTYMFDDRPLDALRLTYQKEIQNPGEDLQFVMEDNFLLSFKRGINDKMIYQEKGVLEYVKELRDGFSYTAGVGLKGLRPGGILSFAPGPTDPTFKTKEASLAQRVNTTEATLRLRYAPNEQYYDLRQFRMPIYNKYPIVTLDYTAGISALGGDFKWHRVSLGFSKRTYVAPLGYFDVDVVGSNIWGQVPYYLLNIPRANQTFSYQPENFNLLNYLEFVSDHQVDFQFSHYFNGFIMNKLPLIRRLKWRSVVTFKALWGGVRDENNPGLHPDVLPGFPINAPDENGLSTQATHALSKKPYMEISVGMVNIFKFLRLDLVRRISYLDHPNAPDGWNLRGRVKVEF